MKESYIKIFRKIMEWEWYKDSQTVHFFIHLILNANFKPSHFMGHDIPRGCLVCGRKQLSKDTGITEQSLRTILERLKSTNEITIKSTNKFSIITLCNYDSYQSDLKKSTSKSTSKSTNDQPAINQPLTTSEEGNKLRKGENTYTSEFEIFWKAYPNKTGKGKAFESWKKYPSTILPEVLETLEWQIKSKKWLEEDGKYIPMPATYLNQRRWEDEKPMFDVYRPTRILQ